MPILQLSFIDHLQRKNNRKKFTIWYNSKYGIKFQRKTIIYIYNTYSWNHKTKVYFLWNTDIPCIFPHDFEVHLHFQNFQTFFKTTQHQKKKSFTNSLMTNIKRMGLTSKMFPTTHGSSSSYPKFLHLISFPHFYLQSQPTNSPLKIIFNIFLN